MYFLTSSLGSWWRQQAYFNIQNHGAEFMDLYVLQLCTSSNHITGAKGHASIQMNVAEVEKVTGRFNDQFKTYAIYKCPLLDIRE
uniref:Uncharacterized protein n=1 Tax=Spermophilus dauricus TaxID=99837 RepID=A0A8C9NXV7_SPEDA